MRQFGVGLKAFVLVVYVALLAPLVVVVGVSFNPDSNFGVSLQGVSLHWYRTFFTSDIFLNALFWISLPVALIAAVFATLIGALAAIALVRFSIKGREVVEATFMLPLLVPSILLGAALYLLFARFYGSGTFASLVVGHTLLGIPYVIRVVSAGLVGINPALEEAAISLGCNRIQAFIKVVLPLLRSSLMSGAIFAFIVSFSDINMALFLAGPHTTTLPLQIFSEIVWQGDPTVAAASTVQIVLVSTLILLAQRVFRIRLAF
jgi:putative spermidine/putrescine transport system permease protein